MGNGASATPYKLDSSRHVRKYSKDYYEAMAKVRPSSSSSGKNSRERYKYVTGDSLGPYSEVENAQSGVDCGRKGKDRTVHVTDGDSLLFSDNGNSYLVPAGDVGSNRAGLRNNSADRMIHVDVDAGNTNAQQDRSFMVGVVE